MSWNQHEWDANVHDQNASTHWANGNNTAYWDSVNAGNYSRMKAQWQRDDEARAAATQAQWQQQWQQPAYNPLGGTPTYGGGYSGGYTGGYSGGSSSSGPGWDVLWWRWLHTWGRGIAADFRTVLGRPATPTGTAPGIGRRLWTTVRAPFTFAGNLAKTLLGLPFAALYVLLRAIGQALKLAWFLFKIVFVVGLLGGLGLWGAYAAGFWDGNVPPAAQRWVAEMTGTPVPLAARAAPAALAPASAATGPANKPANKQTTKPAPKTNQPHKPRQGE